MFGRDDWTQGQSQQAGSQAYYDGRLEALEARIIALEKSKIPPPKDQLAGLKALSAQMEATEHLYAPLRSDTASLVKLAHLARRMLDPHDLGHAVTFEVRELAREALGKEKIG